MNRPDHHSEQPASDQPASDQPDTTLHDDEQRMDEHVRSGLEPGHESPLDVPHTGDVPVDEALTRLAEAEALPLEEQVGAFDAVHRTLQDRLADVDG